MKQISFFPSTALGALLLMMPVPAVTPVVPNGGFEEQGDVLDGDGDMIPVAQDPGDLVETVPGWTAARGGIFNPAGSRFPAWLTTTAHSGNLLVRVPEPSVPLLTAMSVVPLLRRRRRACIGP